MPRQLLLELCWLIVPALITIFFIGGCQKSGETPTGPTTTYIEDDIADALATAFAGGDSTNGLESQLAEAVVLAQRDTQSTTGSVDTTVTQQLSGTNYSYAFNEDYSFIPARDSISFGYPTGISGSFITPRGYGSLAAYTTFLLLSARSSTDSARLINVEYSGYFEDTMKVRNHDSLSGYFSGIMSKVIVSKSSLRVLSGSADLSISLETEADTTMDFDATFAFLGSQSASLVINSRTYTLDLQTGTASLVSSK